MSEKRSQSVTVCALLVNLLDCFGCTLLLARSEVVELCHSTMTRKVFVSNLRSQSELGNSTVWLYLAVGKKQ